MSELPCEVYLEGLHHDYEGFRLLLKGPGDHARMLRLSFEQILSYRNIDEGDYLMDEADYSTLETKKWAFFVVEDSDYLEWFHRVSEGIHKHQNIGHYAIYTSNDCLDILSATPPKVMWLN